MLVKCGQNIPAETMDNFQTVLRFFMNQKATIGYSFMALLTIGGERVFSMVSFQCPCNRSQNFAYGITFLLGPAAVLLVLGMFFSTRLWRLYTGCCLNPMKLCPRGNCLGCLRVFFSILAGACVAPIMWLCVALLNGTFYECAVSGLDNNVVVELFCQNKTVKCREELAHVPCERSKLSKDERMDLLLMLRAQSQVGDAHGVDTLLKFELPLNTHLRGFYCVCSCTICWGGRIRPIEATAQHRVTHSKGRVLS